MKILSTKQNIFYEITEEQSEQIATSSIDGSAPGIWIDGDYINFYEIKSIIDKPETMQRPQLAPGKGYEGIIRSAHNRGLELMAEGLKGFIDKQKKQVDGISKSTANAEELLKKMRLRFAKMNPKKQLA